MPCIHKRYENKTAHLRIQEKQSGYISICLLGQQWLATDVPRWSKSQSAPLYAKKKRAGETMEEAARSCEKPNGGKTRPGKKR